MAKDKAVIDLSWTETGQIGFKVSGVSLPPPRNNQRDWIIAPSAPLLLAHQLGSLKLAKGLIASSNILNMLFGNRYILEPISTVLSKARIVFIYGAGSSIGLQFLPEHSPKAESDSIEESICQLINNYTYFIYSMLDEYLKIVFRTMFVLAISLYLEFVQEQMGAGKVKTSNDWNISFSLFSAELIRLISSKYYVPEGGRTKDNEQWASNQSAHLEKMNSELDSKLKGILSRLGMI
jgi:hypothetical protein